MSCTLNLCTICVCVWVCFIYGYTLHAHVFKHASMCEWERERERETRARTQFHCRMCQILAQSIIMWRTEKTKSERDTHLQQSINTFRVNVISMSCVVLTHISFALKFESLILCPETMLHNASMLRRSICIVNLFAFCKVYRMNDWHA